MKRNIGTMSIGVRCPIIREGDDLAKIVVDSVLAASKEDSLPIEDKDIIAVTESVLARAQGNYANVTDIADDIQNIFGGKKHVGVVFPILSRNRFSLLLKGIARGASKVTIVLSYPSDEVGNGLINLDLLDEKDVRLEAWYPLGHGNKELLENPEIVRLAAKYGKNAGQIVLRFEVQEGFVVLPKSVNPARIAGNLDLFGFELTEDEMDAIRKMDTGRGSHDPDADGVAETLLAAFDVHKE